MSLPVSKGSDVMPPPVWGFALHNFSTNDPLGSVPNTDVFKGEENSES